MLQAGGAMTVIMKDAIKPNIVQTLEGQPALVHAGPFGNIAHAANSILADRMALKLADYVVTEAGFASDLGFQKFCDIVCRTARITPSAAVLVTTVRATKSHGGVAFKDLGEEDLEAIRTRRRQPRRAHPDRPQYGLPCVVTVNGFPTDSPKEIALVRELALNAGAETVVVHEGFAKGGEGAVDLANAVVTACEKPNTFQLPDAGRHADRPADRGDRDEDLRRGGHRPADAGGEGSRAHREARTRHGAGLHGEDADVAVARRRRCATGRPASSCRCARSCRASAPASSSRSAARCSGCPASARRRRSRRWTSTRTATPYGLF